MGRRLKDKVFPLQGMQAYRESSIAPVIRDLSTSWRGVVISPSRTLYPLERTKTLPSVCIYHAYIIHHRNRLG
jgi:hypothetical protein